jgi:tripartite-type tricarboxylate transporter receptor subunit TctC
MFREPLPIAFIAALAFPASSLAQDAPSMPRQTRIIIASVPGAGPDFISRLMAPKLSETLRSSVVVENRPGTNGVVAAQFTAKSAPDGSCS